VRLWTTTSADPSNRLISIPSTPAGGAAPNLARLVDFAGPLTNSSAMTGLRLQLSDHTATARTVAVSSKHTSTVRDPPFFDCPGEIPGSVPSSE
jgi:hypothetical protein